jgi:hypothetical protein
MTNNVLQKFDDLFKNLDNLSMDKVESLVHESLKFFEHLKEKLQSPNEEERKEAQRLAEEVQKNLQAQAEKAYEATGLSRHELDNFLGSSANFSSEEWGVLQRTQKELSEYQSGLFKKPGDAPPKAVDQPKKLKRVSINKLQA